MSLLALPRPPKGLRRAVLIAAAGLTLYALLGFLVLPPILKSVITRRAGALLHRQVSIDHLRLNPFSLAAAVEGLDIRDPDGQLLLRWDRLFVNIQASSLVLRRWVFREIELTNASVRIVMRADGTLNVSDILAALSAPPATPPAAGDVTAPATLPAVDIGRLAINGAQGEYTDRSRPQPFRTMLGPLHLELRNFSTARGEGRNPYSFSGTTESAETFSWTGKFSVDPPGSDGRFAFKNVALNKYHPYYGATVPFDIRDGTADLAAGYEVQWGPARHVLRFTGTTLNIRTLKIAEHDHDEVAIDAPEADLDGGEFDVLGQTADVRSVRLRGGHVLIRQYPDASVNILRMILPFYTDTGGTSPSAPGRAITPAAPPTIPAPATPPAPGLRIAVGEIGFSDYAVDLEDLQPARPMRVPLDQVNLTLRGVDNLPATTEKATLDARWNGAGTLHAEGDLSLVELVADLGVKAERVDIGILDPYLEPFLDARIARGQVAATGRLAANLVDLDHPRFSFKGEVRVDDLVATEGATREEFLRWKTFRLAPVDFSLDKGTLAIGELGIADPILRVGVAADGTSNLARILRIAPAPEPAPTPAADAAAVPGEADTPATSAVPTQAGAPPLTPAGGSSLVTVRRARLSNGQIRFTDQSVAPPVSLALTRIDATLSGLSSRELARAEVVLEARVDDAAPVRVSGSINPLAENVFTNLAIEGRGIDLTPLGPYAGKWLGYSLRTGQLDLDLKYLFDKRRLQAENQLTARQFNLGEKTDSPDATHLPVRLGIALLKDRNGVILLDVPVEGSVDDPEFRLGRVILHAVVNLFTKLVASPFTLLARAFGGGKDVDLSSVEFDPGGAALTAAAISRLETLTTALYERPELGLEIEGMADGPSDGEALRRARLEILVRAEKHRSLGARQRSQVAPEDVVVAADEHDRFLLAAWKTMRAGLKDDTLPKTGTPQELEQWILERLQVSEDDLRRLAAERAHAVRDHLLASGKVDVARLVLSGSGAAPKPGRRVALTIR